MLKISFQTRILVLKILKKVTASGGVDLSVRVPNNNRKVISSMSTLGNTRNCVLGKTLNAIIPNSGDVAHSEWIRAKVCNRKINSRFIS